MQPEIVSIHISRCKRLLAFRDIKVLRVNNFSKAAYGFSINLLILAGKKTYILRKRLKQHLEYTVCIFVASVSILNNSQNFISVI